MKAIVRDRYGSPDVLRLEEVERPTPREGELLIEVRAASLNGFDWHALTADAFMIRLVSGLWRPRSRRLGADIAGRIVATGPGTSRFQVGDDVFGSARGNMAAFAEYARARETALAPKPANVSFEEAAAAPMAAMTALQGLRDHGRVRPGDQVLIYGASGGVGTFAIQIARWLGAEVTAVCSTRNVEQARALGAARVIDYQREDFTAGGALYDAILVANGDPDLGHIERALKPGGRGVLVGAVRPLPVLALRMVRQRWIAVAHKKKIGSFVTRYNAGDLALLADLLASGELRPVIEARFTLEETAEAMRYLGRGHARGKIVLTVEHAG